MAAKHSKDENYQNPHQNRLHCRLLLSTNLTPICQVIGYKCLRKELWDRSHLIAPWGSLQGAVSGEIVGTELDQPLFAILFSR